MGIAVCDRLAESGWRVQRVNNGSTAKEPEHYTNKGAEIWFEGRRKIERKEIILPNDPALIAQLTTRMGWPDSKGRLQVEPKDKMRSRGLPSPDRADAVLGAMIGNFSGGAFTSTAGFRVGDDTPDPFGLFGEETTFEPDTIEFD